MISSGTASASSLPLLPSGRLETFYTGRGPDVRIRAKGQTLDAGIASASSVPLIADTGRGPDAWVAGRGVSPQGQSPTMPRARVDELFSPPRVTLALPTGTGLVAGSTFDLPADVDGVK